MSLLTWLLFESFYALGAFLALALYLLLVYWRRSGNIRPLLAGCAVSAMLLTMQNLVVTQREHAGDILARIERDLELSRTDALRSALSSTFATDRLDSDALLAAVQRRLRTLRIAQIRRSSLQLLDSAADRFSVAASYACDISGPEIPAGALRTRWTFGFVREGGEWKLHSIDGLWVENVQLTLAEVLR